MELRLLRYFVAVAEELNVTRAAERLHTAQPSLSQQIRQLEGLIGGPLFHRDKHRLQLTGAGRFLLPAAKNILDAVDDTLVQARATARNEVGTIILGMVPGPEGMVFSHILPLLMHRAPHDQVLLRTMTGPEIIQALLRRELTAGILRGPIPTEEITYDIYMREDVVVVLPEAWELARRDRVPVRELAGLQHIPIAETISPAVHLVCEEIQRRAGVRFQDGIISESLMMSMNAVASGLGFCFFAEYVSGIVPKGVVTRPLDLDPPPTLDLLFAYRKDDPNPALLDLVRLVNEHSPFQKQLASSQNSQVV